MPPPADKGHYIIKPDDDRSRTVLLPAMKQRRVGSHRHRLSETIETSKAESHLTTPLNKEAPQVWTHQNSSQATGRHTQPIIDRVKGLRPPQAGGHHSQTPSSTRTPLPSHHVPRSHHITAPPSGSKGRQRREETIGNSKNPRGATTRPVRNPESVTRLAVTATAPNHATTQGITTGSNLSDLTTGQ